MHIDVVIGQNLFETYPDIRLGLLQFKAEVKESNPAFGNIWIMPSNRK